MRIVICDPHVAFGESLAHVLNSRGAQVVAVVQKIAEAVVVSTRQTVDVCVVGIGGDLSITGERYTALAPLTQRVAVVVLAETITAALRHECLLVGVRGLGEMRQGMAEVLRLLDRVQNGDSVLDGVARPEPARVVPAGERDTHRLAAFLSTRERAVLSALVRGDDTASMARSLGISPTTARGHVQGVLSKLGTHSRLGAVTLAVRAELVDPATGEWQAS